MAASRVLYVDRVPCGWGEAELRGFLAPYGGVRRVVFLRRHNALFAAYDLVTLACNTRLSMLQALVETHDLETAARIVQAMPNTHGCAGDTMHGDGADCNGGITVSYSRNQELRDQRSATDRHRWSKQQRREQPQRPESVGAMREHRILLVTVQNPAYPITTDLMNSVCSPYGRVEKIVVFVKRVGVQCLVQFAAISEARLARDMLTGLSIFPDCCGLVLNYSHLAELVVKENGLRTRDFLQLDLPPVEHDSPVNPGVDWSNQAAANGFDQPAEANAGVSSVLLTCNLRESVTCDQLFNLFSCYGNVARVKKLIGKPGHALIQFSSPVCAQSALMHLRGFTLLGRSLEICFSRHSYISIRPGSLVSSAATTASSMVDEDTNAGSSLKTTDACVKEYGLGLNRFTGKYTHSTKHIYSPTRILHVSNLDATTTAEELKRHLADNFSAAHASVQLLRSSNDQPPQALAELPSLDAATNLLAQAHNAHFGSRRLKIAFSRHTLQH